MVGKPQGWCLALQPFRCRTQAPLELVIVIGVEQVVFPVVLVVEHHLHSGQPLLQARAIGHGHAAAFVAPATPSQEGLRQVGAFIPVTAINQGLETSPIGPGRGTKDPAALPPFPLSGSGQGVVLLRLLQARH